MTLRYPLQPVRRLALGLLLTWGPSAFAEEKSIPTTGSLTLEPPTIELGASAELIAADALQTEKVQERYPSRTLKIERFVAQDEAGNFFNHGKYTQWAENGRVAGKGEFRHGLREGTWTRWFSLAETEAAFAPSLDLGFEGPFTAQASFVGGHLHGTWTIVDARKRQVAAWQFEEGSRHGMSLWWYADGSKYREVEYRAGELDGAAREWASNGDLVKEEKFVNGYNHAVKVEYYVTGEVKSECETLFAKDVFAADDDFWTGRTEVKIVGKVGRDQRHGKYVAWSKEGQKILSGSYVDDRPEGKFTWWHENGNRAIEGSYVSGKQDGLWTWWHENGLKEIAGEYVMGNEGGNWKQWNEDGQVAETLQILPVGYELQGPASVDAQPSLAPPVTGNDAPITGATTSEASVTDTSSPAAQPQPPEPIRRASFNETLNQALEATKLSVEAVPAAKTNAAKPDAVQSTTVEAAPPALIEVAPSAVTIPTAATPTAKGPKLKVVAPRN